MAVLQPFGGDPERAGNAYQMLGAAAGFQLLDRLVGNAADLLGQLRLGQAQGGAAFPDSFSQGFGAQCLHAGCIQGKLVVAQDIL